MEECRYYRKIAGGAVECQLCPHRCRIADGRSGLCRSRRNQGGKLFSVVYGLPCSLAVDPVEKKPLNHFHPGSTCLSVACTGCNLRCRNCQNHEISQAKPEEVPHYQLSPRQLVDLCLEQKCPGLAYTYTEPLTYIEYVADTARLAHEHGLWNILVSAGFVEQTPLRDLIPYIDAANIDLKYYSDFLYQSMSGGSLHSVLNTILALHRAGVWLELTNLLIPGVNDNMRMIKKMCRWMVDNGMEGVPLHFSRFFPRHKMLQTPSTPISTLYAARDVAIREGIRNVHLGNV
ncbi:MAG: AmmeMemoRadiSam system radical SAM enzyme [Bacteroidaceae bacterium]|nr:AmmeMemoRadiSam system radical SAM enzyme [Bacteroidaceae bacterium]